MVDLLDKDGKIFAWRGNQFGGVLRARDLNRFFHDSIISVEDKRFYSHPGISLRGILGAIRINLKEGRGPFQGHGGSTITQQVAKTLCLLRSNDMSEKKCKRSTISLKGNYTHKNFIRNLLLKPITSPIFATGPTREIILACIPHDGIATV